MKGRLLVVDDNESWRRHIRMVLENHSRWSIIAEASDGLEAVRKAKDLKPDLILLDISLPTLNGIATARAIMTAEPQSRILFISEHQSRAIVEAALRTGAAGYLLKSNAHGLLAAMETISEGRRFTSEGLTDERGE